MKLSMSGFSKFALGVALFCMAQFAMAQATVYDVTGTASAQVGTGAARTLKKGDIVNQGETVSTSAKSLLILRFPDGQVASLVSNSKMTIDTYVYNPADAAKSNVLFSLLEGGMRTVTGLIGKARPQQVSYRAANATIGIRGTDIIIMTNDGNVILQVIGGVATLIVDGMVRVVSLGQAGIKTKDGKVTGVNAEQLAQTLTMLFPNNNNIQTISTDLNANAAKIDAAQTSQTGTTVVNVSTPKDKKTDTNTQTGTGQTPPSNK